MQPATDRGAEQARHVAPGQEAADDGEPELEPADGRIEELPGRGAEVARVHDQVAEPAADDRSRDDPDRDERDVVGSQAAGPGKEAGEDERGDDDADERDRPPAHGQVAEQLGVRVEVDVCFSLAKRFHNSRLTGREMAVQPLIWSQKTAWRQTLRRPQRDEWPLWQPPRVSWPECILGILAPRSCV